MSPLKELKTSIENLDFCLKTLDNREGNNPLEISNKIQNLSSNLQEIYEKQQDYFFKNNKLNQCLEKLKTQASIFSKQYNEAFISIKSDHYDNSENLLETRKEIEATFKEFQNEIETLESSEEKLQKTYEDENFEIATTIPEHILAESAKTINRLLKAAESSDHVSFFSNVSENPFFNFREGFKYYIVNYDSDVENQTSPYFMETSDDEKTQHDVNEINSIRNLCRWLYYLNKISEADYNYRYQCVKDKAIDGVEVYNDEGFNKDFALTKKVYHEALKIWQAKLHKEIKASEVMSNDLTGIVTEYLGEPGVSKEFFELCIALEKEMLAKEAE